MSEMIFLSHYYNDKTPGYGGKVDFVTEKTKCLKDGHSCNQQKLILSNHVGTHVDTPFHFFEKGKKLHEYSANSWVFHKVVLIDLNLANAELITSEHVKDKIPEGTELILFRTGFEKKRSTDQFWQENPGLSANLGDYLRWSFPSVRAVGGDIISATSFSKREEGKLAHQAFLDPDKINQPILIIEDMKLSGLKSSPVRVIVAPLLIDQADGAPVTVMAEIK